MGIVVIRQLSKLLKSNVFLIETIFKYSLSRKHLKMVELCGIEPQTSCVQGRRSPS